MQWLEGFGEESGVREAVLDQVALHLALSRQNRNFLFPAK
jgi:hypothetical protein